MTELENSPEFYGKAVCSGYGCIPAKYMFVGISAGRLGAIITGVPFTKDASGRLFQRFLGRVGLSASDEQCQNPTLCNCYVTNLVKGEVLDTDGLNRPPTPEEMLYWIPVLEAEVNRVNPKLVIALGKVVGDYLRVEFTEKQIRVLRHPRWYQAHGALSQNSVAFEKMVQDYCEILGIPGRR